jgi:apolipoprotein N-acyltransferase
VIAGGGRFADGKEYNSALLYSNGSTIPDSQLTTYNSQLAFYDKVHLVPFGEFIPGDKWITALQKLAPVGSCTPGELKLLGDYGVAICYEDTDSAQMRALLHKGARALVFITNDSWFSDSIEAEQHSWQAVARAVETGLAVIRVGNSGVTGTIDPRGRASWLSRADGRPLVDERGTMCDTVTKLSPPCPTMSPVTFYGTVGDMPLSVSFALLILSMVLVKYRDTYEKRRYLSM